MAGLWRSDEDLFHLISRELFSAVVGDVMDEIGLTAQFLPPSVRPLDAGMRVVGRAMPLVAERISEANADLFEERPFGLMLEALDDLKAGEVYVCAAPDTDFALWGELMTIRARALGAAGAVVEGYYRDSEGVLSQQFPTFGLGPYAQDMRARGGIAKFRTTVRIGQVRIQPGDIVVGDRDGVCVVPIGDEVEVFRMALEKVRGEQRVRSEMVGGMSASEAFARYGIM
ncbi:MAG: RraA family protein [Bryobacterales bacterium]|nr:RraA family protein [Bryobacterales bacterium]